LSPFWAVPRSAERAKREIQATRKGRLLDQTGAISGPRLIESFQARCVVEAGSAFFKSSWSKAEDKRLISKSEIPEGQSVRWIRSFYLPETAQTHCYFEAASRATVEEANKRARIPFTHISEVMEMTPDPV
jgi:hypothetical protein